MSDNSKVRHLVTSLIVFHTLFAAIILLEMPWWNEIYAGRHDVIVREVSLSYGFYIFPFVIWHAGDALQSTEFSNRFIAMVQAYRFALPFFVTMMFWGLAYALDIVDVPGAHEVGTFNSYGIFISYALFTLVVLVAFVKLITAIISRFYTCRAKGRGER